MPWNRHFEDSEAGASYCHDIREEKVFGLRLVEGTFDILLEVLKYHACGVSSVVVSAILLNQNGKPRGPIWGNMADSSLQATLSTETVLYR